MYIARHSTSSRISRAKKALTGHSRWLGLVEVGGQVVSALLGQVPQLATVLAGTPVLPPHCSLRACQGQQTLIAVDCRVKSTCMQGPENWSAQRLLVASRCQVI